MWVWVWGGGDAHLAQLGHFLAHLLHEHAQADSHQQAAERHHHHHHATWARPGAMLSTACRSSASSGRVVGRRLAVYTCRICPTSLFTCATWLPRSFLTWLISSVSISTVGLACRRAATSSGELTQDKVERAGQDAGARHVKRSIFSNLQL